MTKENRRIYNRLWIKRWRDEFFVDKACAVCGTTKNLELDHIDPAEKVSHRIWSWRLERREAELAKCQVLCETHHKEKTRLAYEAINTHGSQNMYSKYKCRCGVCKLFMRSFWKRRVRVKSLLGDNRSVVYRPVVVL